jgi:hypothetical protein
MKIIAAGLAALVITVSPLAQPLAHASSGGYSGGAKYGPEPGQVFGHRHRGARAHTGHGVYAAAVPAASLPDYNGAPNGGFFVNGIFYPHGTTPNIWMK